MPTEIENSQLETLLFQVASLHKHLCPRQVLGVRIGIYATQLFPDMLPQKNKRMLALVETDGCFADGVSLATSCSMGHRTMRLADEGKIAVTFVDTLSGRALRIFALPDLRARAAASFPDAPSRWHAYLTAYKQLAEEEMFGQREVRLSFAVDAIMGKLKSRTACAQCGEEIHNQREVMRAGQTLCRSCAKDGYWSPRGEFSESPPRRNSNLYPNPRALFR